MDSDWGGLTKRSVLGKRIGVIVDVRETVNEGKIECNGVPSVGY
jgi:hypothetical protein